MQKYFRFLTDFLTHWQKQSINHIQFKVPCWLEKGAHILTILYQYGFGFLKFDDGCCVVFKNLEDDAVVRVVQQQVGSIYICFRPFCKWLFDILVQRISNWELNNMNLHRMIVAALVQSMNR